LSLSCLFIDLDNFKAVNDRFGHHTGDQVLRTVVDHTRNHLRKIDVIARIGGDEFVLLLPETGRESAQAVVSKLQEVLLEAMALNSWPITFSIGVLTCNIAPHSTDELLKMTDKLMYEVKCSSKNDIRHASLQV
jgi:diguanylate cyclase (GGDEF)-like protein